MYTLTLVFCHLHYSYIHTAIMMMKMNTRVRRRPLYCSRPNYQKELNIMGYLSSCSNSKSQNYVTSTDGFVYVGGCVPVSFLSYSDDVHGCGMVPPYQTIVIKHLAHMSTFPPFSFLFLLRAYLFYQGLHGLVRR
jgi:hypothetical protein